MIDPMANLDAGPTGGPGEDTTGGEGKDAFDMGAANANLKKMDEIRSFMGIVSGCVAGVLGLTGLSGLGELGLSSSRSDPSHHTDTHNTR